MNYWNLGVLTLSALLSTTACSKDGAGTDGGGLASAAKGALDDASKKLAELDLGKLEPAKLLEQAKLMTGDLSTQLAGIKDSATAKEIVAKVSPLLDQLIGAKNSLMAQKFDLSGLKTAGEQLLTKFKGDAGVMGIVQPLLDKITALTS